MRLILLTVALLLIAACGQKGRLYLPAPDGSEAPAASCQTCPPASTPAPGEDGSTDTDKNSTKATQPNSTDTPQESTQ